VEGGDRGDYSIIETAFIVTKRVKIMGGGGEIKAARRNSVQNGGTKKGL